MKPIRIALIGIGKIARDQHVPALLGNSSFELVAAVSRHQALDGIPAFHSLGDLLDAGIAVDAVSICTPPQARFDIAVLALRHGLDVMLEKPPGATLNEVDTLVQMAAESDSVLFATWHSREAAGVEPARRMLSDRVVRTVTIDWREDVRVWHPGQHWIWEAGGLGVFDPGINALSIVTRILPQNLRIVSADLAFPANCETPVAAMLRLAGDAGAVVQAGFDFLFPGPPVWDIDVEYDGGRLRLTQGGAVLQCDGDQPPVALAGEYAGLYRRFAALVAKRQSDVDVEPLRLVADAFLCGNRRSVERFEY